MAKRVRQMGLRERLEEYVLDKARGGNDVDAVQVARDFSTSQGFAGKMLQLAARSPKSPIQRTVRGWYTAREPAAAPALPEPAAKGAAKPKPGVLLREELGRQLAALQEATGLKTDSTAPPADGSAPGWRRVGALDDGSVLLRADDGELWQARQYF